MFIVLNFSSKWADRCNRFNQLCPKIVSQQVLVPQQVVPQQVVVAQPQQVLVQPVPQQVIVQQKPQKIKFKLFG